MLIVFIVQTVIFTLTLFALVWQIHTLNKQLKDSVYMDIVSKTDALYERLLQVPAVLGPLVFPREEPAKEEDAAEFYLKKAYMLSLLNVFHWIFLQKERGNVNLDSWQRWHYLMTMFLTQPELIEFWNGLEARDERFAPDFVRTVAGIVQGPPIKHTEGRNASSMSSQ